MKKKKSLKYGRIYLDTIYLTRSPDPNTYKKLVKLNKLNMGRESFYNIINSSQHWKLPQSSLTDDEIGCDTWNRYLLPHSTK